MREGRYDTSSTVYSGNYTIIYWYPKFYKHQGGKAYCTVNYVGTQSFIKCDKIFQLIQFLEY